MSKFRAKTDPYQFELKEADAESLDLVEIGMDQFHILNKNTSYHCRLESKSQNGKRSTININGTSYNIEIMDEFDLLVEKMGLGRRNSVKSGSIQAPMPGLVMDVLVSEGQEVSKGDYLFILEAMKMENVIKAEGKGVVKSIQVKKGQAVEKGELIIEMF